MFQFNNTLKSYIQKDISRNLVPMLLGEPGIGKSSWLQDLAADMNTKCFTLACNQLADKADLTGARLIPVTDSSGQTVSYKQTFYPHADIHDAIEYAEQHPNETPILFLDEINRTASDVTSAALSIPTARRIGSINLPDNLRIVVAGNDKGNITSLDSASTSRFVLYPVEPNTQTFVQISPTLNPFIRNVLTAHPECIFCKPIVETTTNDDGDTVEVDIDNLLDDDSMEQFTTPRTISGLSEWLNTFTNQELLAQLGSSHMENGVTVNDLQQAIEAHVGATAFAAYLMQDIANNCSQTAFNQANTQQIIKPAIFDVIKTAPSVDIIRTHLGNTSDQDKSACLLYALYNHDNNEIIIKNVADFCSALTQDDTKRLMGLAANGDLDQENVNYLLTLNSPLANALSVYLKFMV